MSEKPSEQPKKLTAAPLLLVSLIAILALVAGLRWAFSVPEGTLSTAISAEAGPGTLFELENGETFSGRGRMKLEAEVISYERVDDTGKRVTSGRATRKFASKFKITARGLDNSPVYVHPAGLKVTQITGALLPQGNSSFAHEIDQLFWLIMWVTGIAFVLTESFLLFCILRFRATPGGRSAYTHGNHKLEAFWTLGTAGFLIFLAILQSNVWSELKIDLPEEDDPDVVQVQVIARQFEWNFRHPGLDNEFGTVDDVVETGELTVPTGKKILLQLRSQDVIHSFALADFRVKQDIVPGINTPAWFDAKKPGTFQIYCAELCGMLHSSMGGTLNVLPEAEWVSWHEAMSKESKEENMDDGEAMERQDWYGVVGRLWSWWDRNPLKTAFSDGRTKKSLSRWIPRLPIEFNQPDPERTGSTTCIFSHTPLISR